MSGNRLGIFISGFVYFFWSFEGFDVGLIIGANNYFDFSTGGLVISGTVFSGYFDKFLIYFLELRSCKLLID